MKRLLLIVVLLTSCQNKVEIERLNTKIDSLNTKLILIKNNFDSIQKKNDSLNLEENYWFDKDFDSKSFLDYGIKTPDIFIKNSLRKKPELIPLKAVLGGTMSFENIKILGGEWLIADYSDGHIDGKAIYQYKLNKKGELEFKLIKSITPE